MRQGETEDFQQAKKRKFEKENIDTGVTAS